MEQIKSPVALIVDMQVGVFAATPRHDEAGIVGRINALTDAVRGRSGRVVFIRHTDAADGLAEGSDAWQVLPMLEQREGDRYVEKTACDSFLASTLAAVLAEAPFDALIMAGCATEFCFDTTVRAAASLGYPVWVASDAHTTANRSHLDAEAIIRHHNYVWENLIVPGKPVCLASTAELCAELTTPLQFVSAAR